MPGGSAPVSIRRCSANCYEQMKPLRAGSLAAGEKAHQHSGPRRALDQADAGRRSRVRRMDPRRHHSPCGVCRAAQRQACQRSGPRAPEAPEDIKAPFKPKASKTGATKARASKASTTAEVTTEKPKPASKRAGKDKVEVAGVMISHPERVIDTQSGLHKIELAQFYESIADWILPHLRPPPGGVAALPGRRRRRAVFPETFRAAGDPEHQAAGPETRPRPCATDGDRQRSGAGRRGADGHHRTAHLGRDLRQDRAARISLSSTSTRTRRCRGAA